MAARLSRIAVVFGAVVACASERRTTPSVVAALPDRPARPEKVSCEDPAFAPQGCVGVEGIRRLPASKGSEHGEEIRSPSDPEPHYRLAQVFEQQGLLENALDEYLRAVELSHGRHAKARDRAAKLAEQLGRPVELAPATK